MGRLVQRPKSKVQRKSRVGEEQLLGSGIWFLVAGKGRVSGLSPCRRVPVSPRLVVSKLLAPGSWFISLSARRRRILDFGL